jgi:hypothetical protein
MLVSKSPRFSTLSRIIGLKRHSKQAFGRGRSLVWPCITDEAQQ